MKKLFPLILLIAFLACSKEEESQEEENQKISEDIVTGEVELPDNSGFALEDLEVFSSISNSDLTSEEFSVKVVENKSSFLFVSNEEGEIILMKFYHPGISNQDINAESTAIAMIMSMPTTFHMSEEAKLDFVKRVKFNPLFSNLVLEIQESLVNNISPFTESQEVRSLIDSIFQSYGEENKEPLQEAENNPVRIHKTGRKLTFVNSGKLYDVSIGIYKDGNRVEALELDKFKFFNTSIEGAIATASNNLNNVDIDVEQVSYSFQEEGKYEVKIATGKNLLFSEYSTETFEAYTDNMTKWSMDILMNILSIEEDPDCLEQIFSSMRTFVEKSLSQGEDINSAMDVVSTCYSLVINFGVGLTGSLRCFNVPEGEKFDKVLKKYLGWTKYVAIAGSLGNGLGGVGQWLYNNGSMELCYKVTENDMCKCCENGFYLDHEFYPLGAGFVKLGHKRGDDYEWFHTVKLTSPDHTLRSKDGQTLLNSADYAIVTHLITTDRRGISEGTYYFENDLFMDPFEFQLSLFSDLEDGWSTTSSKKLFAWNGRIEVTKEGENSYEIDLDVSLTNDQRLEGSFKGIFNIAD